MPVETVWYLQQINNPDNQGTVIPGEYIATSGPTVSGSSNLFVSVYNDQQHFAYIDNFGNIQDAWYDGSRSQWNLQQINGNANGPPASSTLTGPGALYVAVYNGQQHFA
jgi:hypothetical protein